MTQTVDIADVERLKQAASDFALLDVREPMEFERGHIRGATMLPRRQIEYRIGDLVRDPDTTIVVVDDDSGRAVLAAKTLSKLGYRNARSLSGGVNAAADAGWLIATGTNVPSKLFGEEVHHSCRVPSVDADTLAAWQAAGRRVVVCDLRTPEEYGRNCIPGAVALPSFDIALHASDLASGYETVVVNCAGRTRSIIGARTLLELGHDNVVALENGVMGWILAGHPPEHGGSRRREPASKESIEAAAVSSRRLADAADVRRIDVAALRELLDRADRNRYLFDVRSRRDFERGHIPGLLCLPGGQAIQRADDFIAVRGAPIVLVDEHEVQSNLTAVWLKRMGYPDVAVLAGGLPAWLSAGGTLEVGRARGEPGGWRSVAAGVRRLSVDAFAQALADAPTVLDVDTSRNYRRGHVPGARWVPRGWLELRAAQVIPAIDARVLLTCESGRHSVYAAAALSELGYSQVEVLDGGTTAWAAAGNALEQDLQLPPQDDELLPPYERGRQGMYDYLAWEQRLTTSRR